MFDKVMNMPLDGVDYLNSDFQNVYQILNSTLEVLNKIVVELY